MHYLTNTLLLAGAFVLSLGIAMAVGAFFRNRRKEEAPIGEYFGPEYDRDLLLHSAFSETEDWQADRHSRFAPFRLRDPEPTEQRTRATSVAQRNRDSN